MILLVNEANAQSTFIEQFNTGAGLLFSTVRQTYDGGYITCGKTWDAYPFSLLIKTDTNGDTAWTRQYRLGVLSQSFDVVQTSDSGFITTGTTCPDMGWDPYPFLIKTDKNGDLIWTKKYDMLGKGMRVFQMNDGGYVVIGETSAPYINPFAIRTDGSGNPVWCKRYGGNVFDWVFDAVKTTDNGFAISGQTNSFGAGNLDAYLLRIDSVGTPMYFKSYGTLGTECADGLSQTSDGGFAMTGYAINSHVVGQDTTWLHGIFLLRLDANGDTLWKNIYKVAQATPQPSSAWGYAVVQTNDSGFAITGTCNDNLYSATALLKTDQYGFIQWQSYIDNVMFYTDNYVIQDQNGAYVISAFLDGKSTLVKTDQSGYAGCMHVPLTMNDTNISWVVGSVNSLNLTAQVNAGGNVVETQIGVNVSLPCFNSGIQSPVASDFRFSIYPNPASDYVMIKNENFYPVNAMLEVYDINGRALLFKQTLSKREEKISFSDMPDGIYFLRITDGESVCSFKVLIQR